MQFEDSDRSDFWLLSKNVGTQSWPKAQRECFWRSVSGPPSPWPGFSCVCLKKGSLSIDTNDWKKKKWGCLCDPFLVRKFESHHFDCVSWFFYQQKTEAKSSKSWRYPAVNSVDEAADGIPTASPIDRRVLRVRPFFGGHDRDVMSADYHGTLLWKYLPRSCQSCSNSVCGLKLAHGDRAVCWH